LTAAPPEEWPDTATCMPVITLNASTLIVPVTSKLPLGWNFVLNLALL